MPMRALLLLVCLLSTLTVQAGQFTVFTSIAPVKTLIKQVAGEQVNVSNLVPAGFDPHLFEPGPRQISELARARLYVSTGLPFEKIWQEKLQQVNPDMRLLDASSQTRQSEPAPGPEAASSPEEHQEHGHEHENGQDPHIWTDPLLFAELVPVIVDALVVMDPDQAEHYRANGKRVISALQEIHRAIGEKLAGFEGRSFLVVHPAWGHFAERYGLQQVALEQEGKVGGAIHMTRLIDLALSQSIHTVFVQNDSEIRSAKPLAAAINARIVEINPLAPDYRASLLDAADKIAGSFRP